MLLGGGSLPSMIHPRSGHGCVALASPGDQYSILVAGGTKGYSEHATKEVELFK